MGDFDTNVDASIVILVMVISAVVIACVGLIGALILIAAGWVDVGGLITSTIIFILSVCLFLCAYRLLKLLRE